MILLLDGDTDYLDIVAGVLQEYTLVLFLLIICVHDVQRTLIDLMKENSSTLKKWLEADEILLKLKLTQFTHS